LIWLIGWFNKEFIFSKKVDPKYGKTLKDGYKNRTRGDYEAFILFSTEEVEIMLTEMIEFIEEIRILIQK